MPRAGVRTVTTSTRVWFLKFAKKGESAIRGAPKTRWSAMVRCIPVTTIRVAAIAKIAVNAASVTEMDAASRRQSDEAEHDSDHIQFRALDGKPKASSKNVIAADQRFSDAQRPYQAGENRDRQQAARLVHACDGHRGGKAKGHSGDDEPGAVDHEDVQQGKQHQLTRRFWR